MCTPPTIRLLTTEELDAALALSEAAGWNQRLDDWRMLLRLAPGGAFAALSERRIVGTAIGVDYGRFGWIAMMLVEPSFRGRGLGGRLLEAAMAALPADRPIRLDATPMGRPLYERYGFEIETSITRHVAEVSGVGVASDAGSRGDSLDVDRLNAGRLERLIEEDSKVFGGDRRAVLEWALTGAPHYCRVVERGAAPASYCLGREGRLFDQIGPVVASEESVAQALVATAIAAARSRPVVVDAFDAHARFTTWLGGRGFQAQRPLFRMRRAPAAASADAGSGGRSAHVEFAILGPEFG